MKLSKINKLNGSITIPGDKSISHRSIMLGAISKGITYVNGFLNGADCMSTATLFKELGIEIHFTSDTSLTIQGNGLHGLKSPSNTLDVGNSGTTMRLVSGILSGQNFKSKLTGDASIVKRPMKRIINPLTDMGANIYSEANNGLAPLLIQPSEIHGITYNSPVASAQVKSCIMLATLYANSSSTIIEPSISRNHSELMLKSFGANVSCDNINNSVTIAPNPVLEACEVNVPGDISSAAYFIVAALIVPNSEVLIKNVGLNPTRDGIIRILKDMNANIEVINPRTINEEYRADLLVRSSNLVSTIIEGDIIPTLIDEIPIICIAAAFANGTTIIKDASELAVKESNRIETCVSEFSKLGIDIVAQPDGMIIKGNNGNCFKGGNVESYHDHRIAMSLAIAALNSDSETKINNSNCISISYPSFFNDLKSLI